MGKERKHVRLKIRQDGVASFEAVGFGMAEQLQNLTRGDRIAIAYIVDENTWNGQTKLQLKLRDVKIQE